MTEILSARERRMAKIRAYFALQADSFVISAKLNIPGPDKSLQSYAVLLDIAIREIELILKTVELETIELERLKSAAGYEAIFLLQANNPEMIRQKICSSFSKSLLAKEASNLARIFGRGQNPKQESALLIKYLLLNLEEKDPLGRLFDLDLWYSETDFSDQSNSLVQLGRSSLGFAARKCLICNDFALICAREQRHQLAELLQVIEQLLQADQRVK